MNPVNPKLLGLLAALGALNQGNLEEAVTNLRTIPAKDIPDELADIMLASKPLEVLSGENLDAFRNLQDIVSKLENVDTFAFVAITKADGACCDCGEPHPDGVAGIQVGFAGSPEAAELAWKMLRLKTERGPGANMGDIFKTAVDVQGGFHSGGPVVDPVRGPAEAGTEAPAADVNDKGGHLH